MAAPLGNQNAKGAHNRKIWKSVIDKRLEERAALVPIVDKLIDQALDGDKQAADMLMNRTDGKPPQSVDVTSDGDRVLQNIKVEFVSKDVKK